MSNPTTTVSESSSFLSTLGVNAMLGESPVYSNGSSVLNELQYIGFSKIRSGAPDVGSSNLGAWATLASGGTSFNFIINQGVNVSNFMGGVDNFASQYPGGVASIEGPNEIWNFPFSYNGLAGMAAGVAVQKALYAAVQSDPHVSGVPVLTLTTGGGTREETYNALGDLSGEANYGNVHIYPQGPDPSPYGYLQGNIPWQTSVVSPNLPKVVSEGGYYTMPDQKYGVNRLRKNP
jgi:hypothetical protein